MRKTTLGVIVGNRDFFPDWLCGEGRKTVLKVLQEEGFETVCLAPETTKGGGAIETYADAKKCADLFRAEGHRIDGVLVTLPNFGDERAVANALRLSGLNVPVLVHAFPDNPGKMTVEYRRDSFCGKMSVCNNLRQYGIPFSLTSRHTVAPESPSFRADLKRFGAICRIVGGLRGLRMGAIGARPGNFNTVRYSEKLLEAAGISVNTIDLSEIFGKATRLSDSDAAVTAKLDAIRGYLRTGGVPAESLLRIAKFGAVVDDWMQANDLKVAAIQCWTAIQEFYGMSPCTVMSMMSNSMVPAACEVDITGALGMYILQQASGRPSAIVDWNNDYGDDDNKGIVFHCCNFPKDVLEDACMEYPPILASTLGRDNSYGSVSGRVKAGTFTFGRVSTDDVDGCIKAYVGEGRLTNDPLKTFGGHGVIEVPQFQKLLQHICENGFEHHVAINLAASGAAVAEALGKYMGWSTYHHKGE